MSLRRSGASFFKEVDHDGEDFPLTGELERMIEEDGGSQEKGHSSIIVPDSDSSAESRKEGQDSMMQGGGESRKEGQGIMMPAAGLDSMLQAGGDSREEGRATRGMSAELRATKHRGSILQFMQPKVLVF